jgi:hypothetical protein
MRRVEMAVAREDRRGKVKAVEVGRKERRESIGPRRDGGRREKGQVRLRSPISGWTVTFS